MVDERISGPVVAPQTSAAGRTIAFESFAEQHLPDAYRLASAILGSRGEAEDAVHDAFLAAWRNWDALRNRDAMSRWFDAIVVNTCRNRLRRRRPPPPSTASSNEATSSRASATSCPNPHGGECLGDLGAGTYATQVFDTALTYTVADGWGNFEDLPGNFLLVPPTALLEGVDAGTAEYVGVYDGIAVASADCFDVRQSDVDGTPEAMAAWFVAHPGLETTQPSTITVGGLEGVVVDLWLADDYTGTCPYAQPAGAPLVPMIIGAGPAELHHVVVGETVTRLYLLAGQRGRVLAIELSDVPGGAELDELDAVVDDFVFSTEG